MSRRSIAETARPALSGWMGHEAPFAFDLDYRAGAGIERMRVGTPPVIALAALDAALDAWDGVVMADVRATSIALADLFIAEVEARCPELTLATPRDGTERGSQVSFRHPRRLRHHAGADRARRDRRFPRAGRDPLRLHAALYRRGGGAGRGRASSKTIMTERLWDRPNTAGRRW